MKTVSPFEFAIMQAAGEDVSNFRSETAEEKQKRVEQKFDDFISRIKYRTPEDEKRMKLYQEEIKRMDNSHKQ